MLQQILQDMYVEPELLAELDEEQKHILFCKMREEQVRKWSMREQQENYQEIVMHRKEGSKKVSFLMGGDGEPLVVVLGENDNVDAILQERARKQAELESEAMRKATEEELDKLVWFSQSTVQAMERCSIQRNQSQKATPRDPTRDAVVQSLQEATLEMEREIRALEIHERISPEKSEDDIPASKRPEGSNLVNHTLERSSLSKTASRGVVTTGLSPENGRKISSKPNIIVQPYFNENTTHVNFGVAAQIEQFERLTESSLEALKTATLERAKKRRQKEIFDSLRNQVEVAKKQVEESSNLAAEREENLWREQERKAQEAERHIREIARRAREEHRRTSSSSLSTSVCNNSLMEPQRTEDINGNFKADAQLNINDNCVSSLPSVDINHENHIPSVVERQAIVRPKLRPVRPYSKDAIVEWFQEEELPKGVGLNFQRNEVQPWFHGIISRVEAERLLERAEVGSFLIRVSERIWGYAASYRGLNRCRHYLIDAAGGKYAFLGSNQATHQTLDKLIEFHTREYITISGRELLHKPCAQDDPTRPDYLELLLGTEYFNLIISPTS